jgi:DNA polymerase III subunit gamma/tau
LCIFPVDVVKQNAQPLEFLFFALTFAYTMAENFVVSALKYRPQTFNTVIGQEHITTTLKNAISTGHLAHSFLFCGPRGVGKTTCARILAKTINCTNRTTDHEACDTCDSCVGYKNNSGFNVHELDAASNNSVEDIRELVEQVRFAPQAGSKYKVYIIDEVHMLSSNAFNAFLKTLEEPPSYAIFILATTEKHKILPTILSRCQIFDFKRITTKDTVTHLQEICATEKIPAQEDALHFIALKSEGCMRDALSIMDKIASFSNGSITYESTIENLNILDYDYFFKLTDHVLLQDASAVMLMYDDILSKGFEGDMFVNGLMEHLRNLMVCQDSQTVRLMDIAEGLKKRYHTQANSISYNIILNALSILNTCELNYKMARNKRLHVELALIKLCNLQNAIELLTDANGDLVKKKVTNNFISPVYTRVKKSQASLAINTSVSKPAVAPLAEKTTSAATPITLKPEPPIAVKNNDPQIAENTGIVAEAIVETHTTNPEPFRLSKLNQLKQAAKDAIEKQKVKEAIELTAENFVIFWNAYLLELTKDKAFFQKSLKDCVVVVVDNNITISASDTMGYEFMVSAKQQLSMDIQAHYNQVDIRLQVDLKLDPNKQTITVKSQKQKLNELMERFPLVKELREKLGLETELG